MCFNGFDAFFVEYGIISDNTWTYLLGRDCHSFVSPKYIDNDLTLIGTTGSGQLILYDTSLVIISPYNDVPLKNSYNEIFKQNEASEVSQEEQYEILRHIRKVEFTWKILRSIFYYNRNS
jgi:hypothetical protein